MKITKYPQSCILVDVGSNKILFDPGILKYKKEYFDVFNDCDAVFVTHKHSDHCNVELISSLKKDIPVYSTSEVAGAYPELRNIKIISQGDTVRIGNATITAVKAIHGYQPKMRGNEVYENIGYTLSDGKETIYITSDTICFPTDIKADAICIPVTGHCRHGGQQKKQSEHLQYRNNCIVCSQLRRYHRHIGNSSRSYSKKGRSNVEIAECHNQTCKRNIEHHHT